MIFNVQSYKVITLGSNIINKDTVNGVWLTRCLGGSTVQALWQQGGWRGGRGVPQVGVSPRNALSQGKKEGVASHACSRALHPQPQMLGAQGAIITHSPSAFPKAKEPWGTQLHPALSGGAWCRFCSKPTASHSPTPASRYWSLPSAPKRAASSLKRGG